VTRFGRIGLLVLAVAAPTAGDIGSCGQPLVDLDPVKFFSEKQSIDCSQCLRCDLATQACAAACADELLNDAFDGDCFPIVHDGEVCLNALRAASCDEYANYVDDVQPSVPTECAFCPPERKPEPQP
jgi:hypothetical protein